MPARLSPAGFASSTTSTNATPSPISPIVDSLEAWGASSGFSYVTQGVVSMGTGLRRVTARWFLAAGALQDFAGFVQNGLKVGLIPEALGVEFHHVLGAGGARREPAAQGDDLEPADGRAVAGSVRQLLKYRLTSQMRRGHALGGQFFQGVLLRRSGRRIDARVVRGAQMSR